ncbi:hypothetical protein [Agarivorans aestuarii]|uniref:hypothetical protein n=1 Tax=Agarivorans aestuarii TaxID=1563703 RepID=UPI001C7F7F65|nr:hypothetical protein [Agarivorans aestuarii]
MPCIKMGLIFDAFVYLLFALVALCTYFVVFGGAYALIWCVFALLKRVFMAWPYEEMND